MIASTAILKCTPCYVDVPNIEGAPLAIMTRYSNRQAVALLIGMLSLIGGSGSNFAVPMLVGYVVDAMNQDPVNWDNINYYCFWMMMIVILSALCVWIRGYVFNNMSEKIAQELRYDLFYFITHKDVAFFDETKTGDILSRISSDTMVI